MSVIRIKNKEVITSHTYKTKAAAPASCFSTSPSVLKSFKLTKSWMNCYHGSILLSPHVVQWPKNHDSDVFLSSLNWSHCLGTTLLSLRCMVALIECLILFSNCHQSGSMWREFLVRDCWLYVGQLLYYDFNLVWTCFKVVIYLLNFEIWSVEWRSHGYLLWGTGNIRGLEVGFYILSKFTSKYSWFTLQNLWHF